ncbi:MAG: biotin--[acetyl-CoA-carboxylase] ligase [Flavobacteriaceae bacterium]|nr:biotin--[acetyl-CoA-carboxylase] ligase [Flavobacteriaceae bacterium]
MKIIKLDAINSTNDYLKGLCKEINLENFTVVTARFQTKGKGQFKNNWHSEEGKNLLFSLLVKFKSFKIENQAYLNFAISTAIHAVLHTYLQHVKVKWPNDIMSRQYKICGILIENTVKNDKISQSVIGIGLNVNQVIFPKKIVNVTSLKKELKKEIDSKLLLEQLISSIKKEIQKLENNQFLEIYNTYIKNLYKLNKPSMFATKVNPFFLGKIIGVTNQGKLQVLKNDMVKEFNVKEIKIVTN